MHSKCNKYHLLILQETLSSMGLTTVKPLEKYTLAYLIKYLFIYYLKIMTKIPLMVFPQRGDHCSVITCGFYSQCYSEESLEENNSLAGFVD